MASDESTSDQKLLIEAYKEATAQARNYENLSRAEWILFFPSSGGILGFILVGAFGRAAVYGLVASSVGLIFSLAATFKMGRLRALYRTFAERVVELEKALRIDVNRSSRTKVPGQIFTNKTVPIFLALFIDRKSVV